MILAFLFSDLILSNADWVFEKVAIPALGDGVFLINSSRIAASPSSIVGLGVFFLICLL